MSRWARHLLAFSWPTVVLAYLATGPHSGVAALLWLLVPAAFVAADHLAAPDRDPPAPLPDRWFDAQLYGLVALQIVNLVAFAASVAQAGLLTAHSLVAIVFVGLNSGYSGIVVAHELVHRPQPHLRALGRLLMVGVFYEHFATEHVRGHHARIGTPEDGATARYGEPFWAFFRRTVPQQLRSAWALDRRRVTEGLAASAALAVAIFALLGPGALVAYAAHALLAVMLLEAVNWFEHWGLVRAGARPGTVDSWDAESWVTLYSLVGLSRHADHHAYAARPYGRLRHVEESPKLPSGYLVLAIGALVADAPIRRALDAELRHKRLGPYRSQRERPGRDAGREA